MSTQPDNPPAFPGKLLVDAVMQHHKEWKHHPGMTLRDWMAGQALAGMIGTVNSQKAADSLAPACYIMADAMLRAREGKQ